MRKFFKSLFAISLCVITLGCAGCKEDETTTPEREEPKNEIKYTNTVLAQNGQTDYTIVIPENPTPHEKFAAEELQWIFEEGTGAKLPIVFDTGLTYSEDAKYISISDTTLQKDYGLECSYDDYGFSGARLLTKGNTLFCTGYYEHGALYAVYDLVEILFNYNYYYEDIYRLEKADKVMLPDMDWVNIPDFDQRAFSDVLSTVEYGGYDEYAWRFRYRVQGKGAAIQGHTNDVIIDPDVYLADHPEWFYPKNVSSPDAVEQLCHMNDEMTQEYIKNVKELLAAKPESTEIHLTQVDINSWCDCPDCSEIILKFGNGGLKGNGAVTQCLFLNKVVKAVNEWLAEEYPGRVVLYYTYAYHDTINAPAHKDENGNYVANDPSLVLDPTIVVRYADIYADRNKSWAENPSVKENLKAWAAIATDVAIYEYGQDAAQVCLPYDGLHVHADNLRFAYETGYSNYYIQGVWGTMCSGFHYLNSYVCSKLMWDTSLDVNTLVYDYIDHVYGPAAQPMKEYYDMLRNRLAYLREMNGYGSMCLNSHLSSTNWPRTVMLQYEEKINEAYAEIEYLQYIDEEMYEVYFRNIKIEEMFVQYVNCSLYLAKYSTEEKNALIDEFEYYASKYRFTRWSESKAMSEVIDNWRK